MKKSLIILFLTGFASYVSCSELVNDSTNTLLKELSDNACNCIDSIDTRNSKVEITKNINKCIDDQTGAYQIGSVLMNIDLSKDVLNEKDKKKKKTINININTNKNSEDYKKYYYEIEKFLMDNCEALKIKIASNDLEKDKSMSKDPLALELYNMGIRESKKENYKKAIYYFNEALKVDSVFAFAWDNIGISYRKLNNYSEAINAYKKSLELDSTGLMPLQNIAVAYKYNNEFEKAIQAYQKLEMLDKNNPEVYYGIGETYALYLKDYEKGLDFMCKAYNMYIAQKSPYRADAEKIINMIFSELKKQGNEKRFYEILKENNITAN